MTGSEFDLGYTALNSHEIWPGLMWGKHILYIRASSIFVD